MATHAWLTATTVVSRSIANDQNQRQHGTKHEHHLTNHCELLTRPRKILIAAGWLRDGLNFPTALPWLEVGVST